MAEAIVTLPDGRKARLTGTREQILAEADRLADVQPGDIIPDRQPRPTSFTRQPIIPGVPESTVSTVTQGSNEGALEAFLRAGGARIAGAAANTPNVLLNAARRVPAQFGFVPPEQAPSLAERVIPTPTGQQVIAGAETAVEAPVAAVQGRDINLSQMFGRNLADAEALAQEHPTATTFGEMAGDAATLIAGRSGLARSRAPQMRALREAAEAEAKQRLSMIPEHVREELGDVVSRRVIPYFKEIGILTKRGTKRAAETGIEGATLAILQNGDPESMFWFGAAAQGAGSLSLTLATKPIKALAPFVVGSYLASEMFKAVAPGEQNLFESKDFAIRKAVLALSLGAVSGVAGLGRLRNKTAERLPVWFDAATAAPRAGLVHNRLLELTDNAEAGNDLPLRVMEKVARNPEAFNRNVMNSLSRAFNSKKEGAFTKEVERLMRESRSFRESMEGE